MQNNDSNSTNPSTASTTNPTEGRTTKGRTKKANPITEDLGRLADTPTPNAVNVINTGDNQQPPQVKPAKEKKKSKGNVKKEDTIKDVSNLLQAVTGITAGLLQNSIWVYDSAECEQIARPLVNIFERYDLLEKMSNASDGLMLATALITTTAPRVMLQIQQNKKQEAQRNAERITEPTSGAINKVGQIENDNNTDSTSNVTGKGERPITGSGDIIKNLSTSNY